ncbi:MAG: hypothetical protein ABI934_08590 [Actinomycetota bacterium]
MSTQISQADEDVVAIPAGSHPLLLRSGRGGARDHWHCLAVPSARHNEHGYAPFRTAAKMRDQTAALVVLVRADPWALKQGGEDLA